LPVFKKCFASKEVKLGGMVFSEIAAKWSDGIYQKTPSLSEYATNPRSI